MVRKLVYARNRLPKQETELLEKLRKCAKLVEFWLA
jgi:hypothetical protein